MTNPAKSATLRTTYDGPWKDMVERYLQPFLELMLPALANDIDWQRPYEFLNTELTCIASNHAIGRRSIDKLVKLWMKSGKEIWVLLHIEIQAQPDKKLPKRIFIYRYRIFDKYQHPVISVVILTDNNQNWRPNFYREAPYPYSGLELQLSFAIVLIQEPLIFSVIVGDIKA